MSTSLRRLSGRVALVTGAGRGIGAAIARRLAAEGARVQVTDIRFDDAMGVAQDIAQAGGVARAARLDVTDPAEAKDVVASTISAFGRLDIGVNNAGIAMRATFLDTTIETWELVLRTNLTGTLICAQAFAHAMKKNGGRIVNMASISGQRGGSERAAYGASKAGVINLTQVMAVELAPFRILVNAVAPGPTATGPSRNTPSQQQASFSRMSIPRFATPDEVAAAVAFLASDDCSMTTGHVLNVDGGFSASGIIYRDEEGP